MTLGWRRLAMPILVVGILLFLVAILVGGNVLFGVADILIGVAIGMFAALGAPAAARSPDLYVIGLGIASVGAILDGLVTLADEPKAAGVMTIVVVVGVGLALLGYILPVLPRR